MKKLFILLLFLCTVLSCAEKKFQAQVLRGEALGTTYLVKYYAQNERVPREALDSIFEEINRSMSTYQANSDISRINAGESTVVVDENFREVFQYSKRIYKESEGFFDPTVGVLVNAYGFGPEEQLEEPHKATLDSLRGLVGFDKIHLNPSNEIVKSDPNMYLDFNAIAKGYTVDVIADYLNSQDLDHYLIELGGELIAKGRNPEKDKPWIVAIDNPSQAAGNRTFQSTMALNDRAMATSGNYRKYRIDSTTGERYVHTINPLTGRAEKSDMLSATVLAENCTLADGYATAFMALGFKRSVEMLENLNDVDVYFIHTGENEEIVVYASGGFEEVIQH